MNSKKPTPRHIIIKMLDMENLKKICIATDRSPNEIMGFVDEQTFTKDEQDLIIKFRKLPKDIQEIVINIINK